MNGFTSRALDCRRSLVPENSGTAKNVHLPSSEVAMWAFEGHIDRIATLLNQVFAVTKPFTH